MFVVSLFRKNGIEQSMGEREKHDLWQAKDDSV
jgi:hypothetical protein